MPYMRCCVASPVYRHVREHYVASERWAHIISSALWTSFWHITCPMMSELGQIKTTLISNRWYGHQSQLNGLVQDCNIPLQMHWRYCSPTLSNCRKVVKDISLNEIMLRVWVMFRIPMNIGCHQHSFGLESQRQYQISSVKALHVVISSLRTS